MPTKGTATGQDAPVNRRARRSTPAPAPIVYAQHIQTTTHKRTHQDLWIVQQCPHGCGGVHRHNSPGLRVSACGHLYRVVQQAA